jgi:hypothetical protein
MPSTEQRRVPLAEAFTLATGHEPPLITPEQKADYAAKREAAGQEARRICADHTLGRSEAG